MAITAHRPYRLRSLSSTNGPRLGRGMPIMPMLPPVTSSSFSSTKCTMMPNPSVATARLGPFNRTIGTSSRLAALAASPANSRASGNGSPYVTVAIAEA